MRDGGTGCEDCAERLSWPLEPGAFGTPEDEAAQPESSKPHSAAATAKDRDMENASPLLWRMRFLRMPVLRLRGPRTRWGFPRAGPSTALWHAARAVGSAQDDTIAACRSFDCAMARCACRRLR